MTEQGNSLCNRLFHFITGKSERKEAAKGLPGSESEGN